MLPNDSVEEKEVFFAYYITSMILTMTGQWINIDNPAKDWR